MDLVAGDPASQSAAGRTRRLIAPPRRSPNTNRSRDTGDEKKVRPKAGKWVAQREG